VKFCTLGVGHCTFSTHSKKMVVVPDHLYISTGRKSALTRHHAPAALLSSDQLTCLLKERHSQEEWIRLLHAVNQNVSDEGGLKSEANAEGAVSFHSSVLAMATPARKRKERYDDSLNVVPDLNLQDRKPLSTRSGSSVSMDELVILPSQDSQEISPEERLSIVFGQWDNLVTMVNKMNGVISSLRSSVIEDLIDLDDKILSVDARIGLKPQGMAGLDECGSVWDGLIYLTSEVQDIVKHLAEVKRTSQDISTGLDEKLKALVEINVDPFARRTEQAMRLLESNVTKLAEFVIILNSEQEKLTERSILQITQSSAAYADIARDVEELRQRNTQWGSGNGGSSNAEVRTLQAHLKLIEADLILPC
jgi:hypothetical protein